VTVASFPLLAELEPEVLRKIDQPSDEAGQLTWEIPEEYAQACQQEYLYLWERLSTIDRNFGMAMNTTAVSVVSGTLVYSLPADCRWLRRVVEIDAIGNNRGQVPIATWDEYDAGQYDNGVIYQPDDQTIRFVSDPGRSYAVRLIYGKYPTPLVHGIARDGGATSIQLDDHEPMDDDIINGLTVVLYAGTGYGQSKAASDYDGVTRTVTVGTAWTVNPVAGTKYTSRPSLPRDMRDAFIYGVCARMVEKIQDERYGEFTAMREKHLSQVRQALGRADRLGPLRTRDDSLGSHTDPLWTGYSF
jgi:hypothetical protein